MMPTVTWNARDEEGRLIEVTAEVVIVEEEQAEVVEDEESP